MNVLFVCNGNVARSQEAEAYFNLLVDSNMYHAVSVGINVKVGKPIDPLVIAVMNEDGISLENAQRKLISKETVKMSDLIVSFKPQEELPDYAQESNIQYWDVADPQHQDLEFHRVTRDKIKSLVTSLIRDIAK